MRVKVITSRYGTYGELGTVTLTAPIYDPESDRTVYLCEVHYDNTELTEVSNLGFRGRRAKDVLWYGSEIEQIKD